MTQRHSSKSEAGQLLEWKLPGIAVKINQKGLN